MGSKTGWLRSNPVESEKVELNPDSFTYYVILNKSYLLEFICRGQILRDLRSWFYDLYSKLTSLCLLFVLRGDHFYYLLGTCTKPASSQESRHSPGKLVGVLSAESIVYPGLQEPPGDRWVRIWSEKKNGKREVKRVRSGHQDTKSRNRPLIHGNRLGGSPRTNEEWESHREIQNGQWEGRRAVHESRAVTFHPNLPHLCFLQCGSGWVSRK